MDLSILKTVKTPESYRLLLNVADKINIKKSDKYADLSNCSMHYTSKNVKIYKTINLKYPLQRGMKYLIYVMDLF